MTEIAVAIRSVRKTFAESLKPALDGVSLEILKNEFFTLLGPSGCGKTTLLRMIAGFETPDSGVIELDGVDTGTTPPNKRPVNTVFQSYALFPHMSVEQNIAFALDMLGQKKDITRIRVAEMVRLVKLEGLEQRRPGQLSGGQQQRVALARALAPSPKVLLLDEPLSALDLKLRKEMQVELKRLQTATGITFVFVTHDQEEALTMSDRVAVMQSGVVMQVGSPTDIYERPSNLDVAAFIGDANFLKATCVARSGEGGTFRLALDSSSDVLIEASDANCSQIGSTAMLMVRPERIKLSQPGQASLIGTVRDTIYCGSDLMLHATIAEGTVLRARLDGVVDASNLRGTSTGFLIQAQAVRVFPT